MYNSVNYCLHGPLQKLCLSFDFDYFCFLTSDFTLDRDNTNDYEVTPFELNYI